MVVAAIHSAWAFRSTQYSVKLGVMRIDGVVVLVAARETADGVIIPEHDGTGALGFIFSR